MNKHRTVVVGGTFDKLHRGHVYLLNTALKMADIVVIGLATCEMAKKSAKQHKVTSFEKRKDELIAFLKKEGVQEKVQIVPINDFYGITLDNREIDAIVVSQETAKHALEINELRKKRGLQPLTVTVIAMVLAEDNIPISTTRVKCGEIDRYGHLL